MWPEYQDELKNAFDDVTLMTKTPKEALNTVQERMQPRLDAYLERKRMRQAAGL